MNFLYKSLACLALALVLAPAAASAAPFAPYFGPILSCTANYTQDVIRNGTQVPKCASLCDFLSTGQNIVNWTMTMSLYVVAPVVFVIGAAFMMMGGANPGLLSKGRQMIFGTAMALAMVLGSYVIVSTIFFLIPTNRTITWGTITCDPKKVPGGELDVERFRICSQCTDEQICVQKPLGQGTTWACENRTTCGGQTQGTCPQGQACRQVSGQYVCRPVSSGTNNGFQPTPTVPSPSGN